MNYEIVTLGKKELPIYFGFNALRKYCRATGTSLQKLGTLGTEMSLDDIVELIFHGTQEGHRRAGIDFNLDSDQIADLLDGDQKGMGIAMELFAEHMGITFSDGETEKKETGKKLKSRKLTE
tara:strand:+ start:1173 stop:1538 length:366 start_codon:yes stop_codon:yes gene_type:complete